MIQRALIQEAELTYSLSPRLQLEAVRGPIHELLGFSAEDLLSSSASFFERIHPHDSDVAKVLLSPAGEADSGTSVVRVRRAGGRIRCLQVHFKKEHEDALTVLHLKLRSAGSVGNNLFEDDAAHLRTMVEHTDEELFFKDRNHVFIAASPSFRAPLEHFLNGRDLVGLTDYDFLPETDADTFYAAEKQALTDGVSVDLLHDVVRGGDTVSVNCQYSPVRGKAGHLL